MLQQQWWGNDLTLLTAHSDTKKQEERMKIVTKKLDKLACIGLSNSWANIQILCSCFLVSEWAVNRIKLLPHHCCGGKIGLAFIFLLWKQNFNFITHFYKDHEQGIFILSNWSVLPKMWAKKFNIVIYHIPPLYLVTKTICPLWCWCKKSI